PDANACRRPAQPLRPRRPGGAGVLGLDDRGEIRAGARADLVVLRHNDERMLAYEVGGNPADVVIAGGRIIRG
ncbi:MAG TPA: amidohydrolase family protein, partial [Phycisphaerales bacterium]|nr:amidohydrolase family protein [Phycisphaerales bacterium]